MKKVYEELKRAITKFPTWPDDPLHAVGILNEEVGELNKAVLQAVYDATGNQHQDAELLKRVEEEAVQVSAMATRFLRSIDDYRYVPSNGHVQHLGCAACDRGDFQLGHSDDCLKKETP